jgi:hypothetical protein
MDQIKAVVWEGKRKYVTAVVFAVVVGLLLYSGVDVPFVAE